MAEKHKAGAGCGVDAPLQCRKEATEQVAQARRAPGLLGDELAAAADEEADLGVERAGRVHRAQIGPRAREFGDDGRVLRIGLALAAPDALPRPVHRQARRVDQRQPGLGEHRAQKARRAAEHVDGGPRGSGLQCLDLADQRPDGGRVVVHPMAEQHPRVAVHGAGPVDLPGHIDPDEDIHSSLRRRFPPRHPALAVVALQSDGSRSLISGRDGPRKRGEMPPEPSRAASMIPIPASLPSSDDIPGMADAEAQKKGKAA